MSVYSIILQQCNVELYFYIKSTRWQHLSTRSHRKCSHTHQFDNLKNAVSLPVPGCRSMSSFSSCHSLMSVRNLKCKTKDNKENKQELQAKQTGYLNIYKYTEFLSKCCSLQTALLSLWMGNPHHVYIRTLSKGKNYGPDCATVTKVEFNKTSNGALAL